MSVAVGELELPGFEYLNPELRGERFHAVLRELREAGWLATMPLGFVVLDREAGEFLLRSRSFTFPGMKIAEIFGIPDQWERLAGDPEGLAAGAVDEIVRFEPITPFTARIAMEDVIYRGVAFPKDTIVLVCAQTGNRDPGTHEDPDRFEITRQGTRVLTFGAGPHYCLGVNLARIEMQEALAHLAPRMPGLRLAGEPAYGTIDGIYGLDALPLRWG